MADFPINKPVIYLHFHKCAGTSVVESAIQSGFDLQPLHKNGNIVDYVTNTEIIFGNDFERLRRVIVEYASKPGQFMAFEWDFPFRNLQTLRSSFFLFTVIREPFDRAYSNFRFDKLNRFVDRSVTFLDYMDSSSLNVSNNYYIRMLCELSATDNVTDAHLNQAKYILSTFDDVLVLGVDNIGHRLQQFGFSRRTFGHRNSTPNSLPFADVSIEEKSIFLSNNSYDVELFWNQVDTSLKRINPLRRFFLRKSLRKSTLSKTIIS